MLKTTISFFFSLIFIVFTIAPTVVNLIDKNIDIGIISDINEEEKGSETYKDIEIAFSNLSQPQDYFSGLNNLDLLKHYLKHYSKPHLSLISPPPDLI